MDTSKLSPPPSLSASWIARNGASFKIALVLLLSIWIRTVSLASEAAWHDELATLQFLPSNSLGAFIAQCKDTNAIPSVYLVIEYFWAKVVGGSVLGHRLLSLAIGTVGLCAFYGFTRTVTNSKAALVALAWIGLMPWHVYHSQEIRFYGLVAMLATCSMWLFVLGIRSSSLHLIAVHCVFNALLAWTHPLTVFLFCAQGLFLGIFYFWERRIVLLWLITHILMGLSLFSIFRNSSDAANQELAWIKHPHLWGDSPSLMSFLRMISGATGEYSISPWAPSSRLGMHMAAIYPAVGWVLVAYTLIAMLLAFRALTTQDNRNYSSGSAVTRIPGNQIAVLLALWFLVPTLGLFVSSYLWRPMFVNRYIVYAALPVYILIGYATTASRSQWPRVALAIPFLSYLVFFFPGPSRTPFDRVVSEIRSRTHDGPYIYVDRGLFIRPLQFYARDLYPDIREPAALAEIVGGTSAAPNDTWMVVLPESQAAISSILLRRGESIDVFNFRTERPIALIHWTHPLNHTSP